ncbi:MAG: TRAM domain-containing protein, partial [Actinomycetota bacterium]|nr:TRAM domain-containing protein [Actinomycetota bacterium]
MPDESPHLHSGVPIERVVAGGEGLGRLSDGRVVFVRGGIPGDLATIEVVDERRDWARAVIASVEAASP